MPFDCLQRDCLQCRYEACSVEPAREHEIATYSHCKSDAHVWQSHGMHCLLWPEASFGLPACSYGAHTVQPAAHPVPWQPPTVWPHNCDCGEQCCVLCFSAALQPVASGQAPARFGRKCRPNAQLHGAAAFPTASLRRSLIISSCCTAASPAGSTFCPRPYTLHLCRDHCVLCYVLRGEPCCCRWR